MKGTDKNLEHYIACGSIDNTGYLVIVGFNIFNGSVGKEADITIPGYVFLGICS